MLTENDKRAIREARAAEIGEAVFLLVCWAGFLAWLLS
jgi:hypothetical protein